MTDELLRTGYRRCARLTRQHGTTYYWGVALLPRAQRHHVYAVYALCRVADDIVDDPAPGATADQTASRLRGLADDLRRGLAGGVMGDPVLAAVVDTIRCSGIDPSCFDRFFAAMTMDLTVTRYESYADLCDYMDGSAAVIGEMMLPVLRPRHRDALAPARSLGLAFQLTNFLRDVGEDLDRGRVYLPQEDLRRFDVDMEELKEPEDRRVTPQWQRLMAFEIARVRELYDHADEGLALLPPRSARCVATARRLYAQILDRIEDAGGDVFTERVRVPTTVKAATAARMLVSSAGPTRGPR